MLMLRGFLPHLPHVPAQVLGKGMQRAQSLGEDVEVRSTIHARYQNQITIIKEFSPVMVKAMVISPVVDATDPCCSMGNMTLAIGILPLHP